MLPSLFRQAFALLVRDRRFTVAAVLTLGLGVGANVAVFSVVQAVLLRPLPYPDAGSLAVLEHRDVRTGLTKQDVAMGDFVDLAARQTAFEQLVPYGAMRATIFAGGEPLTVRGLRTGAGLFDVLRLRPSYGRFFTREEGRPGAAPVVVLGYGLWQRSFASDPAVVGRRIRVDREDREIVGVAPPGFRFPPNANADLIVPIPVPLSAPAERRGYWMYAVGRLTPGASIADAAVNLATVSRQLEQEHPETNQSSLYLPVTLRDALVGDTRQPLELLFGAVAVLLVIACANVGHLLLVRGMNRQHEMALRVALGAGRLRLFTQLVTENLLLALVASAAGLAIAHWGVPAVIALVPSGVTVPGLADAGINTTVLAYALAIAVVASLAFSVAPAMTAGIGSRMSALANLSRSGVGRGVTRATSALVVGEVALAIVLLFGAGLIVRSFTNLLSIDPGFRTDRVLAVGYSVPEDRYPDATAVRTYFDRVMQSLRAVRGVEEVGAAIVTPLTGNNWTVPFERADRPVPKGQRPPDVGWQSASAGYFRALAIPLLSGRLFDARDRPGGPTVVVVSEAIERQFFPNGSAVGARIKLGDSEAQIVGVVGNIRRGALTEEPRADMYFAMEQGPSPAATLFIRTSADPSRVAPDVRAVLTRLEPRTVLAGVRPLDDVAAESIGTVRLGLWLLNVFAWIAVSLAAVGIYAVLSAGVRQRTREIGTRMAIGATRGQIVWLVLRRGVALTGAGIGFGALAALLLGSSLTPLLYETSAYDPVTLAAALAVLATVALVACLLPASRAARLDPARLLDQQV